MHELEKKVLQTIQNNSLIEDGDKIVLGVSGGPDSMCLLKISSNLLQPLEETKTASKVKIVVAHINHQLRKEAEEEEEYVKNYCEKNGIEFYAKSIDVKKLAHTNKIGTEEAGRRVRYEFFEEIRKKTNATKIAIAHNKNDKVETILLV